MLLTLHPQVDAHVGTPAGARRRSNQGFRKLDTRDRVLLFLMRMHRNTPFEELGYSFGVCQTTAMEYFDEVLAAFHENAVPHLFFLPKASAVRVDCPVVLDNRFPEVLLLADGTLFPCKTAGNYALNFVSYSGYKSKPGFQVLFCTYSRTISPF